MKKFFLTALAAASMASATPFSYTFDDPYGGQNPGTASGNGDVVGALRRFDIQKVTVNGNGGNVQISVFMNYGQEGGDTLLGSITIGSFPTLNPGDVMFATTSGLWAIPLISHTDTAPGVGGLAAGNLYSVNSFLTAGTVLNNTTAGSYRPLEYVWGQATGATNLGNGTVSTAAIGGAEIRVDLNFTTTDATFINTLANGGFNLQFAAATCGNDILNATAPTPEPFSMALIGSGLVGIGALRRRRK